MRKYVLLACQFLVVLLLVDGLVDVVYPTARVVIERGRDLLAPKAPEATDIWDAFTMREVAGIGNIIGPVISPVLNVDAMGRRATGQTPRPGAKGLLLGASQAFGLHVSDDATVAAALERRLDTVTIMNFSAPGRATAENMTQLLKLAEGGTQLDFVLMIAGGVDLLQQCWGVYPDTRSTRSPALLHFAKRAMELMSNDRRRVYRCADEEARYWAVTRFIYDIRSAVAVARDVGKRFAFVLAPTIYDNDAQAKAIRSQQDPEAIRSMDLVVRELRRRLAAENIPGVFDLSDAFDAETEPRFLDVGSHFDRQGSEVLAQAVVEKLPAEFFSKEDTPFDWPAEPIAR